MTYHQSQTNHIASPRYGDMNKSYIECDNDHSLSTFDSVRDQKYQSLDPTTATNASSYRKENTASEMLKQVKPEGKKRVRERDNERSLSRCSSASKGHRLEGSFSRSSSSRTRNFPNPNSRHRHHHRRQKNKVNRKSQDRSTSSSNFKYRPRSYNNLHVRRKRNPFYSPLPLEWWERSEDCKEAKLAHVDKIDWLCSSREFLVLQTTLLEEDTALEPNMFPYATPPGVKHYTLWSKHELNHYEVVDFVDDWLSKNFPKVRRWQYDDNMGERSILLFHVHVFIEMEPYSFFPRPGLEYFPPHMSAETYLR